LIATGASPNLPQIEQSSPEDILVLRNLLHAGYLKKMRPRTQRILFLGGGLVSLQTLQAMFKAGGQYTIVVKSDRILSQTLDREASEIAERHLREMGIQIIKGRDVVRLKQENHAKIAILDNGEEIETDLIFAGKGIKPNTFFLKGSGVKIQDGILVDEYGETNVEGIYAAGDVARTTDFFSDEKVHYGLWPSAVEQGEIAGKNMAGLKESYSGNLRMNVTQIFGMPIVSIGDFGSKRVAEVLRTKDERKNVYRKLCLDDRGTLIGAILVNEAEDLGIIQGFIKGKRKADFLRTHSIWKTSIRYGFVYKNILQGRL
jgi:NAD(P)H-nitrite reductase large subunit